VRGKSGLVVRIVAQKIRRHTLDGGFYVCRMPRAPKRRLFIGFRQNLSL